MNKEIITQEGKSEVSQGSISSCDYQETCDFCGDRFGGKNRNICFLEG